MIGGMALVAVAGCALPAAAQIRLTSAQGGPPVIVASDLAVFEAREPRSDLPCTVEPSKPLLGFDLRFHAGYQISIPLKELAGTENLLTVLFRVTPEKEGESPVYFQQRIHVPQIEEDAKGDALLQGSFDLGEGRYKIDWIMRDRLERVCANTWDAEAKLQDSDGQLALTLARDRVEATEKETFAEEPPIERSGTEAPVDVRVLVNFAPQNAQSAALRPEDTSALVSILRQFQREPRIHRFSIVAFNLQQQKVVYRQEAAANIDIPAIGKAIESLQLGTVDMAALAQKYSETEFLSNLIRDEIGAAQPPDALVFAGPKAMLDRNVPAGELRAVGPLDYPVFYMNYNLNPQSNPWRDSIGDAIRVLKGVEYTISRPKDLWRAVTEIVTRVVQSKAEKKSAAAKAGARPGS
ncbi:MAG TPA: acetyltransferase [Bryobacteraceae bacterium]|nr:acetyltransferase [Bryobacteraceae bacterium]HPT28666.1 acetyltransferase [Bryobacteraceae bacterium]